MGGDINGKDADGRGILHELVDRYDALKAVKLAISLGCDVNARARDGTTPFMLSWSQHWRTLIAAGAQINDVNANGDHALNLHLSEDLLEFGADVNWANKRGQTPLMLAAKKGDVSLVRALLKAGAHDDATDQDGKFATDYANLSTLVELVKSGAAIDPNSMAPLITAITGKNVTLSLELLGKGLKARLSGEQVKAHIVVLENIAQKNLSLFRSGIFGKDDKAEKRIAKIVANLDRILEAARNHPVCDDKELPEVLRPDAWPRKAEAPTPHIEVAIPSAYAQPPSFNPPSMFQERMRELHDRILSRTSDWDASSKRREKTETENKIIELCKHHKSQYRGLTSIDIDEMEGDLVDIDYLFICDDNVLSKLWHGCFDILPELIKHYRIELIDKHKYDLLVYRLGNDAFEGISSGNDFALHCFSYFEGAEIAHIMARNLGSLPAQNWFNRFPDAGITALLHSAFGDVEADRSNAQQALRWLATQGFRGKIEETAGRYGTEAHMIALAFLDSNDEADFLPKKLTKLPSYFVASAHPAPILKESGKALPEHAVETIARMMLASTCWLQTPALIKVMEVCDRKSFADFALSAYDCWVKNGGRKDGIGFLHALGYSRCRRRRSTPRRASSVAPIRYGVDESLILMRMGAGGDRL